MEEVDGPEGRNNCNAMKPEPLQITPGTNIRWEHSYGIGREYHWCLVSDESDKEGKCINPYTVLFASCAEDMEGKPLDEQPDLVLYADAHNAYNDCRKLPSELLADRSTLIRERDELKAALQLAVDAIMDNARYRLLTEGEGGDTVTDFLNMTLNAALDAAKTLNVTPTDQ